MRSNKGITLTSLIVYMIVFCIVIGTVASVSGYFTKNRDEVLISANSSEQYVRLTAYLAEDLNSINFRSIKVEEEFIDIEFVNNTHHIYIYNNNKIYYNVKNEDRMEKTITICNKIENCIFVYDDIEKMAKISITIEGKTYNNNYSI